MHKAHKDDAEFLFVYIREAHPSDSNWADGELDVKEPKTQEERAGVAGRCKSKLKLGMRTVVDTLDDRVALAYGAWPERIYIVGTDGKIVYRTALGPMGFKPQEAKAALVKLLEGE